MATTFILTMPAPLLLGAGGVVEAAAEGDGVVGAANEVSVEVASVAVEV